MLKKGFDIQSGDFYRKNGEFRSKFNDDISSEDLYIPNIYLCPSQSLLQKWIREVHSIDIDISRGGVRDDWHVGIRKFGYNYNRLITIYKSYEEALEEGLYQALTLIK